MRKNYFLIGCLLVLLLGLNFSCKHDDSPYVDLNGNVINEEQDPKPNPDEKPSPSPGIPNDEGLNFVKTNCG